MFHLGLEQASVVLLTGIFLLLTMVLLMLFLLLLFLLPLNFSVAVTRSSNKSAGTKKSSRSIGTVANKGGTTITSTSARLRARGHGYNGNRTHASNQQQPSHGDNPSPSRWESVASTVHSTAGALPGTAKKQGIGKSIPSPAATGKLLAV